jgi:hypothetical protein
MTVQVTTPTQSIYICSRYVILLAFMAALVIETDSLSKFGLSNFALGLILTLTNAAIIALAVYLGWERYRKEQAEAARMKAGVLKLEWAAHFTPNKFTTTFQFVSQKRVPSSHVLCYHYCSLKTAREVIKTQVLPGTAEHGGLLVSLLGPQTLKDGDPSLVAFANGATREAVFCLSLPHALLFAYEASEEQLAAVATAAAASAATAEATAAVAAVSAQEKDEEEAAAADDDGDGEGRGKSTTSSLATAIVAKNPATTISGGSMVDTNLSELRLVPGDVLHSMATFKWQRKKKDQRNRIQSGGDLHATTTTKTTMMAPAGIAAERAADGLRASVGSLAGALRKAQVLAVGGAMKETTVVEGVDEDDDDDEDDDEDDEVDGKKNDEQDQGEGDLAKKRGNSGVDKDLASIIMKEAGSNSKDDDVGDDGSSSVLRYSGELDLDNDDKKEEEEDGDNVEEVKQAEESGGCSGGGGEGGEGGGDEGSSIRLTGHGGGARRLGEPEYSNFNKCLSPRRRPLGRPAIRLSRSPSPIDGSNSLTITTNNPEKRSASEQDYDDDAVAAAADPFRDRLSAADDNEPSFLSASSSVPSFSIRPYAVGSRSRAGLFQEKGVAPGGGSSGSGSSSSSSSSSSNSSGGSSSGGRNTSNNNLLGLPLTLPVRPSILRAYQLKDDKACFSPNLNPSLILRAPKRTPQEKQRGLVDALAPNSATTAIATTITAATTTTAGAASAAATTAAAAADGTSGSSSDGRESIGSGGGVGSFRIVRPHSCLEYTRAMVAIRRECEAEGTVPLYHYTEHHVAPLIMEGGFRMSTQGQGDGGVYFSTLGPASYELGTPEYEENIIVDCFGKERLEEYRGKHKLDLLFVYGINPKCVEQAPGGRENAKMVPKVSDEAQTTLHIFNPALRVFCLLAFLSPSLHGPPVTFISI